MRTNKNTGAKLTFASAKEMCEFIQSGNDLYNESLEIYLFAYNDSGSICKYIISAEDAITLCNKLGRWSENLGLGGRIFDNPMEICEVLYEVPNWEVV